MKRLKLLVSACLWSVFVFCGLWISIPLAEGAFVEWSRMEGVIVPGTAFGTFNVVGGVDSVAFSWSASNGKAKLNLRNGRFSFDVHGLVLASGVGSLVVGTPSPLVTQVKGTIVCNATDLPNVVLVDTTSVSLSPQGNANFSGQVSLPSVCENMAFLLRVATPGPIVDRWIAHGAVRIP